MRLFFDESGNSGAQIYDRAQPVFAFAGVWLNAASEQHFGQRMSTLRARHRLQANGELKGRTLVKSRRGREAVAELIEELVVARVPMSLLGFDKFYFAPGVIVDDCTDYAYNASFDPAWLPDKLGQQRLIQLVSDHADPLLLEAAWRSRDGEVEPAKVAYGALFEQLRGCYEVAQYATRMANVDLDKLWSCRNTERQRGMGYSPNLTAFNWMMQGCEEQAEILDASNVVLVHDEQSEFREAFSFWWGVHHRGVSTDRIQFADGTEKRLSIHRLARLEFSDSKAEVGIQIADVLASSLRTVMQHASAPQAEDEGLALIAPLHRVCMQRETAAPFPWFFGIPRWQRSMLQRLELEPDPSIPE
jgi:hypothetical protein